MGQIGVQHGLIDRPGRRQTATLVHPLLHAGLDQQIDHAVGRTGIEGLQLAVGADQGDVADPAQIKHGDRARHSRLANQRRVIDGRQRRTLPARRHVGAAEVKGRRHAQPFGHAGGVDQLDGAARLLRRRRLMQHGLAVDADQIQRAGLYPVHRHEAERGGQMRVGHRHARVLEAVRFLFVAFPVEGVLDSVLDDGAGFAVQLHLSGGAEGQDVVAVRLDHRHVHGVERGAGHEAEHAESLFRRGRHGGLTATSGAT